MLSYQNRILFRRWAAGDREAVEVELRQQEGLGQKSLILETLDFLRSFERGEPAKPAAVTYRHRVVLWTILECGSLAAARHYVSTALGYSAVGIGGLPALVLAAPPTPPGQHEAEFADDPAADVQVVPRAGSRTVLFVFTGAAKRFFGPLVLMHQWFRRLDANIVYLRDLDSMFYVGGIASLGKGYDESVQRLWDIASSLGAERILCTGSSAGTFGALRYGLDLAAAKVLGLSGPSRLDDSAQRILERLKRREPSATLLDPRHLDMAVLYRRTPRRPAVRMAFGQQNAIDRAEAENMQSIDGVELDPVPGIHEHNIVSKLGSRGFEARLHWLVAPSSVRPSHH